MLPHGNIIILTDDADFARLLSACWNAERDAPGITLLNSSVYNLDAVQSHDVIVVGPVSDARLHDVLRSLESANAVILCLPADNRELCRLRTQYPRIMQVPLRDDWPQIVLLVAGESLRRVKALRLASQAKQNAAQNEVDATLGRYMSDMEHSVNNALTSMLGNAELLLQEPGQLSTQSLSQIKTIRSMALRVNEIMQRFSTLSSEMHEAENASQAETEEASASASLHR